MDSNFEDVYAKYLALLGKLDEVEDISQKNRMFRELAGLLSEMESSLKRKIPPRDSGRTLSPEPDLSYWI